MFRSRTLWVIAVVGIGATISAQVPASLAFEVASVKPNRSGDTKSSSSVQPGGRYIATNVTLRALVRSAYGVQHDVQLVAGPSWIDSDRFDIIATSKGNPSTEVFREQARLMLRTLLVDRFKLALHNEKRDIPIYALVLARTDGRFGPQLHPSTVADCSATTSSKTDGIEAIPCGSGFARTGHLAARAAAFSTLVTNVSNVADRPVVDRTGLTGTFNWDLQWTVEPLAQPEVPDALSLFTALREQLGLKLEPVRGTVEVLVIDRVDRLVED